MIEYNTKRKPLPMPEYGRSIQKMVDHALTLQDRMERQRCANTIVNIMGNMFPQFKDVPDFKHKLWDHLAVMSDYKLDIDYPYEIRKKDPNSKPTRIPYGGSNIRFRHYGRFLEQMLAKLEAYPEGPRKQQLLDLVAQQMKRSMNQWNPNVANDAKLLADLKMFTHGTVEADIELFAGIQNAIQNRGQKNNRMQQNNKNAAKKKRKK